MGKVQRFERLLQGMVGDAFARVFGGNVVPQEVAQGLRREADDNARPLAGGRVLAPNRYTVTLGAADHDRLAGDEQRVIQFLQDHIQEHLDEQGWDVYGDVVVTLERSETLHTGQFRTSSSVDPDASRQVVAPPRTAGDRAMSQQPGQPPEDERRGQHGPPGGYSHDQGQGGYSADQNYNQQYGYDYSQGPASQGHNQNYADQGYGSPQGGYDQNYSYDPNYAQGQHAQSPPEQPYGQHGQQYGQDQARGYDQNYGDQSHPQGGYGYDSSYGQGQPGGYGQGQPGQSYNQNYGDQNYNQYGGTPSAYGSQNYGDQNYAGQAYGGQNYAEPGYPAQGYPGQGYGAPAAPGAPGAPQPGYPADPGVQGYAPPAVQTGQRQVVASLTLDDGSNRSYQLTEGSNVVGRGQDAHFRLPDTGVSRRHLEITWDGQVAVLADLGSTNGTTVNGTPVQTWKLADGDVVRAGHSTLVFRTQS